MTAVDIDLVADFDAFEAALTKLEAVADWAGLARALRSALHVVAITDASQLGGRPKTTVESELWRRLGLIYRDRLADAQAAQTVFELLVARDPQDADARALLASLHDKAASSPSEPATSTSSVPYADQVVFHLQQGQLDAGWCAAAVAVYLGEPGAHAGFYEQYARREVVPVAASLAQPDWFALCHPDESRAPRALQRAIEQSAKLPPPPDDESARARARLRFEPAALGSPMFRPAYAYAARLLGLPSRDHATFAVTEDVADPDGPLDGVHAGFTLSELLFVAGKQAAYHRSPVREVLSRHADASELASATGLDATSVERWLRGVEHTAVRAGLLASGDLHTAKRVLAAEPRVFREVVDVDEAMSELLAFATSPRYLALRRKTGRALVSSSDRPA